ncbi:pectin lyase fold/virulence factor [Listeria phage LIS04]|nr:pectin lyase fold/virulence factor [Listeria phage LIS04]
MSYIDNLQYSRVLHVNSNYQGIELGTENSPYSSISSALVNAEDGDLISIAPGLYRESLSSSKKISLVGVPGLTTVELKTTATLYKSSIYGLIIKSDYSESMLFDTTSLNIYNSVIDSSNDLGLVSSLDNCVILKSHVSEVTQVTNTASDRSLPKSAMTSLNYCNFNSDYVITSAPGYWVQTGTGTNSDGTQSDIGVYGGQYSWTPQTSDSLQIMDTRSRIRVSHPDLESSLIVRSSEDSSAATVTQLYRSNLMSVASPEERNLLYSTIDIPPPDRDIKSKIGVRVDNKLHIKVARGIVSNLSSSINIVGRTRSNLSSKIGIRINRKLSGQYRLQDSTSVNSSLVVAPSEKSYLSSRVFVRLNNTMELLQTILGDSRSTVKSSIKVVYPGQSDIDSTLNISSPYGESDSEYFYNFRSSLTVLKEVNSSLPSYLGVRVRNSMLGKSDIIGKDKSDLLASLNINNISDLKSKLAISPSNKMSSILDVVPPTEYKGEVSVLEDSYVRESLPKYNFGEETSIVTGYSSSRSEKLESLVKFTTSELSDLYNYEYELGSVLLKLQFTAGRPPRTNLHLYSATSDWTELGVTWSNKPDRLVLVSSDYEINQTSGYITFDISSYIKDNLSKDVVSFYILHEDDTLDATTTFFSKESDRGPTLEYTYYDQSLVSSGKSDLESSILVTIPAKSSLPSSLEVKSYWSQYDTESSIYVLQPDERIGTIIVSKPDLFSSIAVSTTDDTDLNSSLSVQESRVDDTTSSITITKPDWYSSLYVSNTSEIESSLLIREESSSDRFSELVVSKPDVPSQIEILNKDDLSSTIIVQTEVSTDLESSIVTSRPDVLSTVTVAPYSQLESSIKVQRYDTSTIDSELVVTQKSVLGSIYVRFNSDLDSVLQVVKSDSSTLESYLHVSQPNLVSSLQVRVSDNLESSVIVRTEGSHNLDSNIYIANRADIPSTMEIVGASMVPSSIQVLSGYLNSVIRVPAYDLDDLHSKLSVSIPSDLMSSISVNTTDEVQSSVIVKGLSVDNLVSTIKIRRDSSLGIKSAININSVSQLPTRIKVRRSALSNVRSSLRVLSHSDLNSLIRVLSRSSLKSSIDVKFGHTNDVLGSIIPRLVGYSDVSSSINTVLRGNRDLVSRLRLTPENKMTSIIDVTTPEVKSIVVSATKDAYVKKSTPTVNYGLDKTLAVYSTSDEEIKSYLGFSTPSIPKDSVVRSVKLVLETSSVKSYPVTVYTTVDSWTETGITWSNKPSNLDLVGNMYGIELDITDFVSLGSSTNLVLTTSAKEYISYYSKESGSPPKLVIEYEDASPKNSGRSTLDSKLNVVYKGASSLDSQLEVRASVDLTDIDSTLVVRSRDSLNSSINVSRDTLESSIEIKHTKDIPSELVVGSVNIDELESTIEVSKTNLPSTIAVPSTSSLSGSLLIVAEDDSSKVSWLKVSRPDLDSSLEVMSRSDLTSSINIIGQSSRDLESQLQVNNPNLESSISVRSTSSQDLESNLAVRKSDNFELDSSIDIVHSKFRVLLGQLRVSKPDLPSSINVEYSKLLNSSLVIGSLSKDINSSINVSRDSLNSNIEVVKVTSSEVPTNLKVSRPDMGSSIEVLHSEELDSKLQVNSTTNLNSSIEISKPDLVSQITVPTSKDVEGHVRVYRDRESSEIDSSITVLSRNNLPSSVEVYQNTQIDSSISVLSGYLSSSIKVRETDTHDVESSLIVALRDVSNLQSSLEINTDRSILKSTLGVKISQVLHGKFTSRDTKSSNLESSISPALSSYLNSQLSIRSTNTMYGKSEIGPLFINDLESSILVDPTSSLDSSIVVVRSVDSDTESSLSVRVRGSNSLDSVIDIVSAGNSSLDSVIRIPASNKMTAIIPSITAVYEDESLVADCSIVEVLVNDLGSVSDEVTDRELQFSDYLDFSDCNDISLLIEDKDVISDSSTTLILVEDDSESTDVLLVKDFVSTDTFNSEESIVLDLRISDTGFNEDYLVLNIIVEDNSSSEDNIELIIDVSDDYQVDESLLIDISTFDQVTTNSEYVVYIEVQATDLGDSAEEVTDREIVLIDSARSEDSYSVEIKVQDSSESADSILVYLKLEDLGSGLDTITTRKFSLVDYSSSDDNSLISISQEDSSYTDELLLVSLLACDYSGVVDTSNVDKELTVIDKFSTSENSLVEIVIVDNLEYQDIVLVELPVIDESESEYKAITTKDLYLSDTAVSCESIFTVGTQDINDRKFSYPGSKDHPVHNVPSDPIDGEFPFIESPIKGSEDSVDFALGSIEYDRYLGLFKGYIDITFTLSVNAGQGNIAAGNINIYIDDERVERISVSLSEGMTHTKRIYYDGYLSTTGGIRIDGLTVSETAGRAIVSISIGDNENKDDDLAQTLPDGQILNPNYPGPYFRNVYDTDILPVGYWCGGHSVIYLYASTCGYLKDYEWSVWTEDEYISYRDLLNNYSKRKVDGKYPTKLSKYNIFGADCGSVSDSFVEVELLLTDESIVDEVANANSKSLDLVEEVQVKDIIRINQELSDFATSTDRIELVIDNCEFSAVVDNISDREFALVEDLLLLDEILIDLINCDEVVSTDGDSLDLEVVLTDTGQSDISYFIDRDILDRATSIECLVIERTTADTSVGYDCSIVEITVCESSEFLDYVTTKEVIVSDSSEDRECLSIEFVEFEHLTSNDCLAVEFISCDMSYGVDKSLRKGVFASDLAHSSDCLNLDIVLCENTKITEDLSFDIVLCDSSVVVDIVTTKDVFSTDSATSHDCLSLSYELCDTAEFIYSTLVRLTYTDESRGQDSLLYKELDLSESILSEDCLLINLDLCDSLEISDCKSLELNLCDTSEFQDSLLYKEVVISELVESQDCMVFEQHLAEIGLLDICMSQESVSNDSGTGQDSFLYKEVRFSDTSEWVEDIVLEIYPNPDEIDEVSVVDRLDTIEIKVSDIYQAHDYLLYKGLVVVEEYFSSEDFELTIELCDITDLEDSLSEIFDIELVICDSGSSDERLVDKETYHVDIVKVCEFVLIHKFTHPIHGPDQFDREITYPGEFDITVNQEEPEYLSSSEEGISELNVLHTDLAFYSKYMFYIDPKYYGRVEVDIYSPDGNPHTFRLSRLQARNAVSSVVDSVTKTTSSEDIISLQYLGPDPAGSSYFTVEILEPSGTEYPEGVSPHREFRVKPPQFSYEYIDPTPIGFIPNENYLDKVELDIVSYEGRTCPSDLIEVNIYSHSDCGVRDHQWAFYYNGDPDLNRISRMVKEQSTKDIENTLEFRYISVIDCGTVDDFVVHIELCVCDWGTDPHDPGPPITGCCGRRLPGHIQHPPYYPGDPGYPWNGDGDVIYPDDPRYPGPPYNPGDPGYPSHCADGQSTVYPGDPCYPGRPLYPGDPGYPIRPGDPNYGTPVYPGDSGGSGTPPYPPIIYPGDGSPPIYPGDPGYPDPDYPDDGYPYDLNILVFDNGVGYDELLITLPVCDFGYLNIEVIEPKKVPKHFDYVMLVDPFKWKCVPDFEWDPQEIKFVFKEININSKVVTYDFEFCQTGFKFEETPEYFCFADKVDIKACSVDVFAIQECPTIKFTCSSQPIEFNCINIELE